MVIFPFDDYESLSVKAAEIVSECVLQNPGGLICAPTGGSPTGMYEKLAIKYRQGKLPTNQLRIIKLDEWGGIPLSDPNSCESYLSKHLLTPLEISSDRYFSFESMSADPQQECNRMQGILQREGPIDCCILGLGKNGHIGFNEPGLKLNPHCHYAPLSPTSLSHEMAKTMMALPTYGITIGPRDILASKLILLIITGKGKEQVIPEFLTQQVDTQLPASLLWLHSNTVCLLDNSSTA